jgi:hypothetical protein
MSSRFRLFPILNQYRIVTNVYDFGPATVMVDLDVPGFSELLPEAEEITLFTLGESMTVNLRWGIFLCSGYSRSFEAPPVQIGGTVGAVNPESLRHAPYNTVASFQLESRLQLGIGNATGTALESGIVSATIGLKLVGL